MRRLRFLVAQDPLCDELEWENAIAAVTEEMDALQNAMRRDLFKIFKYATMTNLPGKKRANIKARTVGAGTDDNTPPISDG